MGGYDIIQDISLKKNIKFSSVKIGGMISFLDFIRNKTLNKLYETSQFSIETEKKIITECVYSTHHPFYLHLSDDNTTDIWSCNIYYDINQSGELEIFLKQLIKQFKNDRVKS
jgi:hypothetical protein